MSDLPFGDSRFASHSISTARRVTRNRPHERGLPSDLGRRARARTLALVLCPCALIVLLWVLIDRAQGVGLRPAPATANGTASVEPEQPFVAQALLEIPARQLASAPVASSVEILTTTLVVRVLDAERREPIGEIRVSALPLEARARLDVRRAITGPDGVISFFDIEPGAYRITTDRGGSLEARVNKGESSDVLVLLDPGVHVSGRVVDPAGYPVPGAEILISEEIVSSDTWGLDGQPNSMRGVLIENLLSFKSRFVRREDGKLEMRQPAVHFAHSSVACVSDDEGRFDLRHVARGRYVHARKAAFAPSNLIPVSAAKGGRESIELELADGGCALAGEVLDPSGAPVEGAVVEVGDPNAGTWPRSSSRRRLPPARPQLLRTDAAGSFRAVGLHPGNVHVTVHARGFASAWQFHELSAGDSQDVVVRLERGVTVRGVVVDEAGLGIADALVQAHEFRPIVGRGAVRSDATGHFVLEDVAPAGERGVVLVAADAGSRGIGSAVLEGLEVGDEQDVDVVVGLGDALLGQVTDSQGRPLKGWRVSARTNRSPRSWEELQRLEDVGRVTIRGRAETCEGGMFAIPGCLDVDYTVSVYAPPEQGSCLVACVTSAVTDDSPLRIVVPDVRMPSASLSLRVQASPALLDELHPAELTMLTDVYGPSTRATHLLPVGPDGTLESGPIPPGEVTLVLRGPSGELARRTYVLEPGQQLRADPLALD